MLTFIAANESHSATVPLAHIHIKRVNPCQLANVQDSITSAFSFVRQKNTLMQYMLTQLAGFMGQSIGSD